jgi:aspartate/methionine/tyrosine aminotransferase
VADARGARQAAPRHGPAARAQLAAQARGAPALAAAGGVAHTRRPVFSSRLAWDAPPNALALAAGRARAAGRAVLDLTLSNPSAVGLAAPGDALAAALADPRAARYEPHPFGLESARAAVADDYARRGVRVDPARIVLTASTSESYGFLLELLCDPGGRVAVPEPSYPLFEQLTGLAGVRPAPYRLGFDGEWHVDFPTVAAALADAGAAIVVSPNNPTGSFATRGDLRGLAERCAAGGAALVVDEVFADYALAPPADAVRVAAGEELPALVFSLGGLSKSCGLPQLKLGWLAVSGPDALVSAALARLELICDARLSVGTPVQLALPRLFALGAELRERIAARLAANLRGLADALRGGAVSLLPVEAGWSAILRLPAVRGDEAWALALLEQDGVWVQPGYFFDLEMPACVVVSLLTPPEVLAEGVARLLGRVARVVG